MRIIAHPGYPNRIPFAALIQRLAEATADASHAFWPDDVSLLDRAIADPSRIHGVLLDTQLYLVRLADSRKLSDSQRRRPRSRDPVERH